jgi:hypothetical protein
MNSVTTLMTSHNTEGNTTEALPQYFRNRGYHTFGCGKVFHPGKPANNDQNNSWSEPYVGAAGGPCRTYPGGHPSNYACTSDAVVADDEVTDATVAKLQQLVNLNMTAKHGKPFFVAGGIHKPHLPYFFKPKYGEMYPAEHQIIVPPPEALSVPLGVPPVAWMACMGLNGEEQAFTDFNNFNITIDQPVPRSLVQNVTRARRSFFDRISHSRMPLVPTPARLKFLHARDQ